MSWGALITGGIIALVTLALIIIIPVVMVWWDKE